MLLALTLVASLHAASTDSLSGKWALKGDVVGNPLNTICEIAQVGHEDHRRLQQRSGRTGPADHRRGEGRLGHLRRTAATIRAPR